MPPESPPPDDGAPRPVEIRLNATEKTLEIDFDDGRKFCYPAEFLRAESPSAENKGHGPGQETLVGGRRHVGILRIEPVGNYAIEIHFDDLHNTGIYSWRYLYEIGSRRQELWQTYLEKLSDAGLSRDP